MSHDNIDSEICMSLLASICTAYNSIRSVPDTPEYDELAEAVHEARMYLNKSHPDKYSI